MSSSAIASSSYIPTLIVTHPFCKDHFTGKAHPESAQRIDAISQLLIQSHLLTPKNFLQVKYEDVFEHIINCHSNAYYCLVAKECAALGQSETALLSTGDTEISKNSLKAAKCAVNCVLKAIDQIMAQLFKNAFCLIRPPGHHGFESAGSGFCLFNNVAIGVRYVQKHYHIQKILIVDWDAHHGNGTQAIFYEDPHVFYFSTHNEEIYPRTGLKSEIGNGKGSGTTLNCPVKPNKEARQQIKQAFTDQLIPAMKIFRPEFVFISAGFDASHLDTMGGLNLTDEDFIDLTMIVKEIADKYARGRILSALEGGYDVKGGGLAAAAKAHVSALSRV